MYNLNLVYVIPKTLWDWHWPTECGKKNTCKLNKLCEHSQSDRAGAFPCSFLHIWSVLPPLRPVQWSHCCPYPGSGRPLQAHIIRGVFSDWFRLRRCCLSTISTQFSHCPPPDAHTACGPVSSCCSLEDVSMTMMTMMAITSALNTVPRESSTRASVSEIIHLDRTSATTSTMR